SAMAGTDRSHVDDLAANELNPFLRRQNPDVRHAGTIVDREQLSADFRRHKSTSRLSQSARHAKLPIRQSKLRKVTRFRRIRDKEAAVFPDKLSLPQDQLLHSPVRRLRRIDLGLRRTRQLVNPGELFQLPSGTANDAEHLPVERNLEQ